MASRFLLEVCAFNVQSCIVAEQAGAQRVELCDDPPEGGTTPSFGTLKQAREKLSIEIYPIIRPRGGNFLYDDEEFSIIKRDIKLCKELGCEGISIGMQLANGKIDSEKMKRIASWAYPMELTCHKVFDVTPDAFEALETLIDCGFTRVLTSGHKKTATEGIDMLAKLVSLAADRIIIMPGGGVRAANMEQLIKETKATEYHSSARTIVPSLVSFNNPEIPEAGKQYIADKKELENMIAIGVNLLNGNHR